MKTLLLIDANSIIHRSFHAIPPLTTPDGRPIQAIYGMSNILLKLWREERPDYAAALFDRPEPTFRKEQYEEYKAHRPAAPRELISQIIEAHTLFDKFGVPTFEKPGFEADDLVATLAEKFKNSPDLRIVILTGDLDTLQLIDDGKVFVRTFKKGISDTQMYDERAVRERYGLRPSQLIDYKALVGDASDNIKGVPGVGSKTASELLKKFGTLESVYDNADADEKIKKKLGPFKREAALAKMLVTIDRHVPMEPPGLSGLKTAEAGGTLVAYFKQCGFATLVKRMGAAEKPGERKSAQSSFFAPLPNAASAGTDLLIVRPGEAYRGEYASGKVKVGFGLKATLKGLWKEKLDLAPPYFDLGVAFWLLEPDRKDYAPENVAEEFLKKEWAGNDDDFMRAHQIAAAKLKERGLLPIFERMEMPLLRILGEMEAWGIGVDRARLGNLERDIKKYVGERALKIYALAGREFNINSPRQVGDVLFTKLGVGKHIRKTKGGAPSTREEVLEELRGEHEVVGRILEYREAFKMLSTYVLPLRELTGKEAFVHTEYVQTGTGTGRLSSQAPNLQNIPQESEWAKPLRSAFVPAIGSSFLAADYSQLELRIMAELSGDKNMRAAFAEGRDIHRVTAAKVLGIAEDRVGPNERRLAKTLNFGLIYGMGANSFAKSSGLARDKAKEFIDAYFREFARVRGWQEATKRTARTQGYVETPTGRRRYLFGSTTDSGRAVADAERAAINFPVQGFGADLVKLSMIGVRERLRDAGSWGDGVKMLLSIHDELLFEVRDDMIQETAKLVKEVMEQVHPLSIPLEVSLSCGKDWGHLAPLAR